VAALGFGGAGLLELAAPGPVGSFLEVTAEAYDNAACRVAGALAGTAAGDELCPLTGAVRALPVKVEMVALGLVEDDEDCTLVIRLSSWWKVWENFAGED
jgi:hypothetical protein